MQIQMQIEIEIAIVNSIYFKKHHLTKFFIMPVFDFTQFISTVGKQTYPNKSLNQNAIDFLNDFFNKSLNQSISNKNDYKRSFILDKTTDIGSFVCKDANKAVVYFKAFGVSPISKFSHLNLS